MPSSQKLFSSTPAAASVILIPLPAGANPPPLSPAIDVDFIKSILLRQSSIDYQTAQARLNEAGFRRVHQLHDITLAQLRQRVPALEKKFVQRIHERGYLRQPSVAAAAQRAAPPRPAPALTAADGLPFLRDNLLPCTAVRQLLLGPVSVYAALAAEACDAITQVEIDAEGRPEETADWSWAVFSNIHHMTLERRRELLSPERCTPARLWTAASAREQLTSATCVPYLDYNPFPLGPFINRQMWVEDIASLCTGFSPMDQGILPPEFDDGEVQLAATGFGEQFHGRRWRATCPFPVTTPALSARQVTGPVNFNSTRGEDEELLNTPRVSLPFPAHAKHMRSEACGEQLTLFFMHGPSINPTHWDATDGASCLFLGWKVFVDFDIEEWGASVGQRWPEDLDQTCPPLDIALLLRMPSLRWSLLGPGTTHLVVATRAHFVISLTSCILLTSSRTHLPHNLMRALAWSVGPGTPVGSWLENVRPAAYSQLVKYIHASTVKRWEQWETQGRRGQEMMKLAVEGWARVLPNLEPWFQLDVLRMYPLFTRTEKAEDAVANSASLHREWSAFAEYMKGRVVPS